MNFSLILQKVREGDLLSTIEINRFVKGLVSGEVSDAQAGAFAMAVCINGFSQQERIDLTLAMRDSGELQKWDLPGPVLDKHSTGGIGDNVSLILAPALAACGAYIPMISGRGLGHTGGTLDKLESIPGYKTSVSPASFRKIVTDVGCAIVSAGEGIAPADKRLYSIRDITSTVESIDLITASILSKKMAAGLDCLVLDVKVGNGAFIKNATDANKLARSLVDGSTGAGCRAAALLTDMNQPLAPVAGNSLEVKNAVELLTGRKDYRRLRVVTKSLGAQLLHLSGLCQDLKQGEEQIEQSIVNGSAVEKFAKMIFSLGGPADFIENYSNYLPSASCVYELKAEESGFISEINLRAIGQAVIELGGGRKQQSDLLDLSVGFDEIIEIGEVVKPGNTLCRIHGKDENAVHSVSKNIRSAFTIKNVQPVIASLVGGVVN
jgi:thymidine phosphorylase